ncbi:polysaccharide biosynthesis/export family protein [Thalassococcus sp. BH17M4-6]|uniref:polysaccharide biosynthesis/export family protein n=1 Tax=Thalassococcus sp. BH17M4-6 TaxID=3413148 RepID=UPI003BD6C6F7
MTFSHRRATKAAFLVLLLTTLAACGLPRSGPNKNEIFDAASEANVPTFVVAVNERVTQAIPPEPVTVFPAEFVNAGALTPGVIRPGDTLSFTVYENVDDGLFAQGAGAASIRELQVDDSGFIFIPYAGRIRAMGNTPERLRQIITDRLAEKTPEPQVVVQRSAGDGGTVSVVGSGIGGQGSYPLQRSSLRLMGLIADAGGVVGEPEVIRVIVIRGRHRAEMWYEDIYDNPKYDIALRPGDRIIVEQDARSFIALGATGRQGVVPFGTKTLSALEAIALVGGLSNATADPTGIFVIRDETPATANRVLGRTAFTTEQRLIYLLNLTEPSGLFLARNFDIHDGDTVYVTEAPFTQWTKTLNAITGTASTVQTLDSIATTATN